MQFKEFLNEMKTYSEDKVIKLIAKGTNSDGSDLDDLRTELAQLDSVELLGGKFDKTDIAVAVNRWLDNSGADVATFTSSTGNYTSSSEMSKALNKLIGKL